MGVLHLTKAVFEAMRSHAEETYPHECCGVLLGKHVPRGWQVTAAARTGNARTDSAHNRYQIAPAELVKIELNARRQGLDIAGFYHSHPDHPAQWSTTDFAEAHWIGCAYVITAVYRGAATVTNAFHLAGATEEDKHFEWQAIELIDAS